MEEKNWCLTVSGEKEIAQRRQAFQIPVFCMDLWGRLSDSERERKLTIAGAI